MEMFINVTAIIALIIFLGASILAISKVIKS